MAQPKPAQELHRTKGNRSAWGLEPINYGQKITEPGDWGSGIPAGTDLPPRGQPGKREGSPTKLRRRIWWEPMEVVAWA